jgi:hypothetical protein
VCIKEKCAVGTTRELRVLLDDESEYAANSGWSIRYAPEATIQKIS